jgi:hypothetical protein
MTQYVVYRHGRADAAQGADQGLPRKMAVARVDAGGPEEACRLAAREVSVSPNQHLTAEPAADVDAREQNLNRRVEALPADPRPGPEEPS